MRKASYKTILKTIYDNGGISYSLHYGNLTGKQGFAVSPYKERETIVKSVTANRIKDVVKKNIDLLNDKSHFLGVWVDKDTTYLDVCIFEPNKIKAIEIAKNNNQLAIYDLSKLETIYL